MGVFAVARPVNRMIDVNNMDYKSDDKKHLHGLSQYIMSKQNTRDAAEYTQYFHNIFLDSSTYTKQKGEVLKDYNNWCIGTDFPFSDPKIYNFDVQVKRFLKHMTKEQIEHLYINALNFIETPVDELAKNHYNNSEYVNRGTPRKRRGYVPGRK